MRNRKPSQCKMEFGRDEFGCEILLKDEKFQVMMEWERPYMEACIDALKPFGDVLEIGFGCGYSATRIQAYQPKSHTIVEYHPVVAERARKWAKQYPNVMIVEDTWQNALPKLGVFDTVFFDDYPLESENELTALKEKSAEAHLVVRTGKKKMLELEAQLPFLKETKYTNRDLDAFFVLLESEEKTEPEFVLRFFCDLQEQGNIKQDQLERVFVRLVKEKYVTPAEIDGYLEKRKKTPVPTSLSVRAPGDRLFEFLDPCLKGHMRIGSRFSCFLHGDVSKFEDEKFFNLIIVNPFLEYHEERIPIEVPENCAYFQGREAIVITITKL